ncbi:MAG TPA: hypothetical protein VK811_09760 [Candidatus Acidoferrum sp.]|jgi:hypothetical protein|nr:hypothetical protein [Candidatus Acidoferrum sp.]
MEPERKIEKWLRSYAKRRRRQAKDDFGLHSATRRLLQDEIARKGPAPEEDDDSFSIWELFRQQWAWLLVFTACIFLIASILMPVVYKAKEKSEATLGTARLEKSEEKLDLSQAVVMNDRAVPQAEPSNAANEPAPSIAPPPAVPLPAPNTLSASSQPTTMAPLAVNSDSALPAMIPSEAAAPASAESDRTLSEQMKFGSAAAQPQLAGAVQNAFQNSTTPSQAIPVLSNFQVQQNGNALRIVDQDGSVYVGSWRLASQSANNENARKQALLNLDMAKSSPQTSAPPALALADNLQAAQNYFFRVHGMNRTLKLSVVFTGSLLANFAPSGSAQQTFGGGVYTNEHQVKTDLTNQAVQLPWPSLRISGTAVINRTNHIEVNATPVTTTKQN